MSFFIRQATVDNAAAIVNLVQQLTLEPDVFVPLDPGEFQMTLEEERAYLARIAESDNSVFLVAEREGQLVGTLSLNGGTRKALRHVATLGMSVARACRGQRIGRALLEHAIDWARHSGVITRIDLLVFAENKPAIRLYEKLGFQHEGRRRAAAFRWGRYCDDLVMGLLLSPDSQT